MKKNLEFSSFGIMLNFQLKMRTSLKDNEKKMMLFVWLDALNLRENVASLNHSIMEFSL